MEEVIRYKVTVVAVVERVEKAGKEWKPTTTGDGSPYAYTPEIEKTVQRDVQVFEQQVKTLDMAAFVSVVNGLPAPGGAATT